MSLSGRPPKDDDQKVTRHPLTQNWIDVPHVPYDGERPKLTGRNPAATKAWWAVVSTMPHCVLWEPGDWQFALTTARIHAAVSRGELARAQELRVREGQMGTTYEARRNLRIRYVDQAAAVEGAVEVPREMADFEAERRRRLMGSQ